MAIDQKFPNGMKVVQVPLSWFRKVTSFLNNLCAGTGLKRSNPTAPSDVTPVEFAIDEDWLDERLKGVGGAYTAGDGIDAAALAQGEIAVDPAGVVTVLDAQSTAEPGGYAASGEEEQLRQDTWEAGGSAALKACLFTRAADAVSGGVYYRRLFWREFGFAPNGTLASVSEEKGYVQVRRV